VENKVLNEPVVIYNTFNEFELACRFIRLDLVVIKKKILIYIYINFY